MENSLERWWFLPLIVAPSTFGDGTILATTITSISIFALFAWFATFLLYWTHPGGPAWGKHWWWKSSSLGGEEKRIPGPSGLPIIGSMALVSSLAHRRLAAAAKLFRAERLMAFSLGETRAIVASHTDVAKEILNSPVFADRPPNESAYGLMFHRSIGFAPQSAYWRTLRRIATAHLFAPKQVHSSAPHRSRIADEMIATLRKESKDVRVRPILKRASLYYIMQIVFGKRYELGSNGNEVDELLSMVDEGYELLGMKNWSDHLPLLARFDLQGIRSRFSKLMPRVNQFIYPIINEHRAKTSERTEQDFVDVLLSLQGSDRLLDADIAAVLWEMIFRGTDTMVVLIEWTLARLILHPEIQGKVHEELNHGVGASRPVMDADFPELVYTQALLKEVLRLHPPGPLLSWCRMASSDTLVDGYFIPAGTTAMVNMWAIARNPDVWEEPLEFRPERFITKRSAGELEFSVFGTDLRLAPFGSGRRSCPGKGLAWTTVGLWVAALLHEFEWMPSEKDVDLSEVLRLSCEMANPLEVRVRPRRYV